MGAHRFCPSFWPILLKVTRDSLGPLLETRCKFRSRAAREQKEGILSVDKIPSFLPLLGKIDIWETGPHTAKRRECAVNSQPPKAAENLRRANSLRPSADQIKSGGSAAARRETHKEGHDYVVSFFVPILGKIDICINTLRLKVLRYGIPISALITVVDGLGQITSNILYG